ncbi:MAG: leucyl/phenylalanyl-tRNA--protein transferase [Pseudomonadota bacterium]
MTQGKRTLPWLDPQHVEFPHPSQAWREPNGLLAVGGALSPQWLLHAYHSGVFPWFDDDEGPILWWSPDPRAVIEPTAMRVRRSLRKRIRNGGFEVRSDTAFEQVVAACAAPRGGEEGTWITAGMQAAFTALHRLGHAHSIEVWQSQRLVGGLYGVAVGTVFCGESMFSRSADASKVAFFALCQQLSRWNYDLIDCQLPNEHLMSLGVRTMGRSEFLTFLNPLDAAPESALWALDPDLLDL